MACIGVAREVEEDLREPVGIGERRSGIDGSYIALDLATPLESGSMLEQLQARRRARGGC